MFRGGKSLTTEAALPRIGVMNIRKTTLKSLAFLFAAALIVAPSFAQDKTTSPPAAATTTAATAQPSEADMMKQMAEMAKLNENHKLLGELAGTWSYAVQMWMAPDAPPSKSSGTAVTKPIMGGRYFVSDVTGHMKMPGPDGKMKDFMFKGMGLDGYDNAKKKFVGCWVDNMGTGILMSQGDYDPATKTFTYAGEYEMIPGAAAEDSRNDKNRRCQSSHLRVV